MVFDPKTEATGKGTENVHHVAWGRNYHMADNTEKLKRVRQRFWRVTCSAVVDSQADVNHEQKIVSWRIAVVTSTSQKETEYGYNRGPLKIHKLWSEDVKQINTKFQLLFLEDTVRQRVQLPRQNPLIL